MHYRIFGNTDLLVSEIGFGAWAIGGGAMIGETSIGWGDSNDAVSKKAIFKAIEQGINFFDTADIYGLGHSEELLGKTIGDSKSILIASKVGNVSRDNKFTVDYSPGHIVEACEASLRRLQRETIDYYQLHTARLSHLQENACMEAMEKLQQEGKIRYWGLSLNTFDPIPEANYLMEHKKGSGFQLVLNLLNQRALGIVKHASTLGYGIIARMPLQFGLLTGKFDKVVDFPSNDHRKNRLTREVISASNEALAPVWELCQKYSCTKLQLSLSYILSYPGVSTVIPGIRTEKQAIENTSRLFKLDDEDILRIETFGQTKFEEVMDRIQQQG
jgi:aryl-alcohol dehydrogenase-like predicted oxidoreductase